MRNFHREIMIAFLVAGLTGCGSANFSGRSASSGSAYGRNTKPEPKGSDAEGQPGGQNPGGGSGPIAGGKNLDWNLECEGTENSAPQSVDTMIEGGGQFEVAGGQAYNLKFKGKHCDGVSPKKDILFLFDGSASMSFNDPLTNGTCGRLDTMKAIIQSFGAGSGNRFAMVSFSSGNQSNVISSGKFHDTDQNMISALVAANGNKSIEEIVCNSNRIGTNYNTGFAASESLINLSAAKDAGTIVFFVSDGQPLFGQTGEVTAGRMKASGVVIATVMVAGNEEVMRDKIASRDTKGLPLHIKVANISQLTNAIAQLASKTLVPDILRYRPVNTTNWTVVNLFPVAGTLDWELQETGFDQATYPDGIEVEYLYFMPDTTGKGTLKGSLTFAP